jgi:hypothetical protein
MQMADTNSKYRRTCFRLFSNYLIYPQWQRSWQPRLHSHAQTWSQTAKLDSSIIDTHLRVDSLYWMSTSMLMGSMGSQLLLLMARSDIQARFTLISHFLEAPLISRLSGQGCISTCPLSKIYKLHHSSEYSFSQSGCFGKV